MEIQSEKRERTFIKLIIGGLAGIVLVIALGYVGINLFHRWQEARLVRRAAAYFSGGDSKAATLSARRAFQMNPTNADAARILARIADREGDRMAIDWWRKVTNLQPHNNEDTLALAQAALRMQDVVTATKALGGLDETAEEVPEYQAALARLAEIRKDLVETERRWRKASDLAPDNGSYKFQLAATRLGMTDPSQNQAGREALEKLRASPKERAAATRALVLHGLTQAGDLRQLQTLASELQSYPEALFEDRLLYLEVLRNSHDLKFSEQLEKLEKETSPTLRT